MGHMRTTARKYVPEKVRLLMKAKNRSEKLQKLIDNLQEEVVLDIIDGWPSGDDLVDFALVSCGGIFSQSILNEYKRLYDLPLIMPGHRILVIEKSLYWPENYDAPIFLRNIYLATLRKSHLKLSIDNLTLSLPVEPKYLMWREFLIEDTLLCGFGIVEDNWLNTGPIYNEHCDFVQAEQIDDFFCTPHKTTCDVELLTKKNNQDLLEKHWIDSYFLDELYTTWIRAKTQCK